MVKRKFSLNREKVVLLLDGPKADALLDAKAEEAKALMEADYAAQTRHRGVHVPGYENSFFIRKQRALDKHRNSVNGRQIGNSDARWYWVEFGAHAGGKTPVLHYRILGRALDAMEAAR